jgi:hypothetical protein
VLARALTDGYIRAMCGRIIQSSGPLRYAIVDGMNVRDSRVHNYPPRWNGAPSQELLVIRRNHQTGEISLDPLRWGLIPYWCNDPKGGRKPINAKYETVRDLPTFRDAYRKRRCILPVDGFFEWKAIKGQRTKQPYAIAMSFSLGFVNQRNKPPINCDKAAPAIALAIICHAQVEFAVMFIRHDSILIFPPTAEPISV